MGETLRRTLEYLGIAEDEEELPPDDPRAQIEALERRVEEQADAIAALRAEVAELRARS